MKMVGFLFNNPNPRGNIVLNPFNLNWNFLHHNYCEEVSRIISLGQFVCENLCIAKNGPHLKSGQALIVQIDSVVIRIAKAYLATPGATVHGHYGEILYKRDTLVTFIYEKLIDSISMNLEQRIEGWNKSITKIIGIPWTFFIGAELTIVQGHIPLVNKIQKVYQFWGCRFKIDIQKLLCVK